MEIGADYMAPSLCGLPPSELSIVGEWLQGWACFGAAVVQFKTADGCAAGPLSCDRALSKSFAAIPEAGLYREKSKACKGTDALSPFELGWILQLHAEQLHSTADAQEGSAAGAIVQQLRLQAALSNRLQISQCLFAAGQDHGIGLSERVTSCDPAQAYGGFRF